MYTRINTPKHHTNRSRRRCQRQHFARQKNGCRMLQRLPFLPVLAPAASDLISFMRFIWLKKGWAMLKPTQPTTGANSRAMVPSLHDENTAGSTVLGVMTAQGISEANGI